MAIEKKNAWEKYPQGPEREKLFAFAEDYRRFISGCKTERECTASVYADATGHGFVDLDELIETGKSVKAGDKIIANNMGKGLALFIVGSKPLEKGMNILGAHIDSPRMDLKQVPLYEDTDMALFDTHYYGGIKKYQWPTIPLALIGVIYTRDGKKVEINVGMKEGDPIFYVSDLLIHMAQDQMKKTLAEGITGEQLQAIAWTNAEGKAKPKELFMKWLKDTYGIEEEDFATAELELVPATKSRDVGFDRSLIASYGQDDRVCSYANLEAILDAKPGVKTQAALLTDKEEIGSYGNTGMESSYFVKFVMKLLSLQGQDTILDFYETMENSEMLSADVNSCLDPMFPEVSEKDNASFMGYGINLTKYGGARGKAGSNDANAEFLQKIRTIFNEAGVCWQIGELGKVDQGGGGTIAFMMADWGAEVVDCGTAMLSMHSPYDLLSKADAYETYLAYKAFFESK